MAVNPLMAGENPLHFDIEHSPWEPYPIEPIAAPQQCKNCMALDIKILRKPSGLRQNG
jgi:hypothetical protein